jgi:hypothetical protein
MFGEHQFQIWTALHKVIELDSSSLEFLYISIPLRRLGGIQLSLMMLILMVADVRGVIIIILKERTVHLLISIHGILFGFWGDINFMISRRVTSDRISSVN